LGTLPIVLLLFVSSYGAVAAQTSGPSLNQSIDHAAACGLFQLSKEFRQALEHCNRALQDNPGDHSTLLNRGSAHLTLGNLDEALSDFDRAIEMKPEDPRNYFNRALVHGAKKDHRRAIADYHDAVWGRQLASDHRHEPICGPLHFHPSYAWKWQVKPDREAVIRGKSAQQALARGDSPVGIVVVRGGAPLRMGE
jgi:tetratricopeptide (TPR) repeat protein